MNDVTQVRWGVGVFLSCLLGCGCPTVDKPVGEVQTDAEPDAAHVAAPVPDAAMPEVAPPEASASDAGADSVAPIEASAIEASAGGNACPIDNALVQCANGGEFHVDVQTGNAVTSTPCGQMTPHCPIGLTCWGPDVYGTVHYGVCP